MSTAVPPLLDFLAEIPDFRKARGQRFAWLALLLSVCVAMLCGRQSQAALAAWGHDYGQPWLERLGFRTAQGPSQPTIHRLFKGIRREHLEQALVRWAEAVLQALAPGAALDGIAIDGKTLRGSEKQGAAEAHLLSALSQRLLIVLGQVGITDKTNEIGVMDQLLALISVTGRVITTDALHTQRETAQAIVDHHGDYRQVVKDNQPQLLEDMATLFTEPAVVKETIREAETTDAHGNRIEERHLYTSTALVGYMEWPGLQPVLKLDRRTWNKQGQILRQEVAYGVTSLSPERASAAQLLQLWREHWHIENNLHDGREVTLSEDRAQVRTGHIPQVMVAFRNVTIALVHLCGWSNVAAACRRFAARPQLALAAVGITT